MKKVYFLASIVLLSIARSEALDITNDQVNEAMRQVGYSPNPDYVNAVVSRVNSQFTDLNNAAEFIAQCGHESGGYQYIEEIACSGPNEGKCEGQYGQGAPGKFNFKSIFIKILQF